MRQAIALVVVVSLVSGLAGAWVFGQLSGQAGAAPQAQPVREQNLDGSGFIRVHEQGTANVNVTNGSIPVSGTVNVGNFPPGESGRLIELTMTYDITIDAYISPFVDVADCASITMFSRGGVLTSAQYVSPDGSARIFTRLPDPWTDSVDGSPTSSIRDVPAAVPFIQARVYTPQPGAGVPSAWIWCVL